MATFAGYLVYGLLGAIVATVAVFLPVYLFVVVPGPLIRRHEQHPCLQGFVKGDQVAEEGAPAEGRITGIERKLDGGTDTELLALEVGDEPRGTRIRTGRMERLRLGMPVLLRVDDQGRAGLDWPAMCERWGDRRSSPRSAR